MAIGYWGIIIITLIMGLGTQAYINSQYKKWLKVPISTGLTGAQAARGMLDANGLQNVQIDMIGGKLSDNYDPRSNVLHLSEAVYKGFSVASTAIACHEAGHAVQHARGYVPAKVRMAIVPVVSFASNVWIFLLLIGFFLNMMGLVWLAIGMYAFAVLFQVVTLPVEFNASSNAMACVNAMAIPQIESAGARSVLTAAALTYVAAALSSILQLLYFIGMARD